MARAAARIIEEIENNEQGVKQPCVYATCVESEDAVGPVWGSSEASKKRALALLTELCGCGASYHYDEETK